MERQGSVSWSRITNCSRPNIQYKMTARTEDERDGHLPLPLLRAAADGAVVPGQGRDQISQLHLVERPVELIILYAGIRGEWSPSVNRRCCRIKQV